MIHARSQRQAPREGLTVVAVIVCLVVLLMLSGVILKIASARRLVARELERGLQADWLAESGLERALGKLAADPSYKGETWTLAATDLERQGASNPAEPAAAVLIKVEPIGTDRGRITVVADFPPNPPERVRRAKRLDVDLKPRSGAVR